MKKIEEIKASALERNIPILMEDSLAVIEKILEEKKPEKLLEIGTAIGYSALCFSTYVVDRIDTIEMDTERVKEARQHIEEMQQLEKINIIEGNAVEILPTIQELYDVVFIDAAKSKYPIFLEQALRLTKDSGIIIADNVLYKGYVLGDYNKHKQRTAVRNLREFIKTITEDENLKSQILEVGDGMAIIQKVIEEKALK